MSLTNKPINLKDYDFGYTPKYQNKHEQLIDEYMVEQLKLTPSINDVLGIKQFRKYKQFYVNNLTDLFLDTQEKLYQKYLDKLKDIPKKSRTLFLNVFEYQLNNYLENLRNPIHLYMPINHLDNEILMFIEDARGDLVYKFENSEDYDMYLIKTKFFGEYVETAIQRMKEGIQKGFILPKISVNLMITQLEDLLKDKNYYKIKSDVKLDYNFGSSFGDLMTDIITNFLAFLKNIYLDKATTKVGLYQYKNGKKLYRQFIKNETTKDLTAKSIHKMGLAEVERISNAMDSIRRQLKYEGTLGEFLTYLTTDKEFRFSSKEDMMESYKQMQKEVDEKIMPKLFEQTISHKCEIVPIPEEQQDTSPGGYYIEGDLKGDRKGKFYLNIGQAKNSNNFDVESLYLHEGMPGHHYQLTLVNSSQLPLFVKCMQNTAYMEGWALYCENLGEYRDPISYMGKLNLEMLRAIRLVVDTGIHHFGWTYNQCKRYFIKYSLLPEHEINSEIERYIVLPGQALAYKIGEFSFNEIKEYYEEQKKSLKEFHKDVLQFGALPLEMLENVLMD